MWGKSRTFSPRTWPSVERPRVVLESQDFDRSLERATALRRAGFTVGICPGPSADGDVRELCPLVAWEDCALVDGADVVVWSLGSDRPDALDVLDALRLRRPSRPLVVELAEDETSRRRDELSGCEVVLAPATAGELVAAVQNALTASGRAGATPT